MQHVLLLLNTVGLVGQKKHRVVELETWCQSRQFVTLSSVERVGRDNTQAHAK
jgi:hypothetical protein